ncbi:polysaccharide deacetylase family protein [Listeria costaricensis]|uniref:polysaccharide deacetylase family protein n=1 Tax=Listeria costaricensis TaxID=2026604 RepID=UPI000C085C28|nr:polysaccharide deacetylase family protein [Listeria costaricensis]
MSFRVLMYHELRDRSVNKVEGFSAIQVAQDYEDQLPPVLFTYVDDFKAQMQFLKENDYHLLSMQEVRDFYEKGSTLPEKAVLLTFDDAFQSVYELAYPVLKELGMQATLFVVRGWLNKATMPFDPTRSVVMSEAQLAEIKDVFTLANHSTNLHTKAGAGKSAVQTVGLQALKEDLAYCAEIVDEPHAFAYPFGFVDAEQDPAHLKEAGIDLAFTTTGGKNDRTTNPYFLHRETVVLGITMEAFKLLID